MFRATVYETFRLDATAVRFVPCRDSRGSKEAPPLAISEQLAAIKTTTIMEMILHE